MASNSLRTSQWLSLGTVAGKFFACAVLAITAGLLTGCTAQHKPGPTQSSFFFHLERASFWLRAPRVQDPLPANADVVLAGHEIYSNQCSICHNADGKGTTLGLSMYPQATDLTGNYAQGFSDRELYYLLWNGVGHTGMPKWDTQLNAEQVWRVIHFMRTMPGENKPAPSTAASGNAPSPGSATEDRGQALSVQLSAGRQMFESNGCRDCHTLAGKSTGDNDGPDLTYEGDRGRSKSWLIGHFIDPPAYSPASDMPSFGKLSGDDLQSLALFLNSLKRGTTPQNRNSGG